jgi:dihydroneopterin aldolase
MEAGMSDSITIKGIRGFGFHGVLPEERRIGQEFVVDLKLNLDLRKAAANDDLALTVHYGEVAQVVVEVIQGPAVDLIETLAEKIASQVLRFELVVSVDVEVHKPQAPIPVPFTDVSVKISRP